MLVLQDGIWKEWALVCLESLIRWYQFIDSINFHFPICNFI